MSGTAEAPTQALPLWAAAQLVADWWSDPTDTESGRTGLPTPVQPGEHSDPAGPVAEAVALLLGVEPALLAALAAATADTAMLAIDYEQLLVGPGRTPCPPYESMWFDDAPSQRGVMMSAVTAEVLKLYRSCGLKMRPHAGELADHLVVEWEAVAWCLEQDRSVGVASALLADHLAKWLPRFCARVADEATHPYYRALAALTPAWTNALVELVERQTAGT